jgi:hypothetical protein
MGDSEPMDVRRLSFEALLRRRRTLRMRSQNTKRKEMKARKPNTERRAMAQLGKSLAAAEAFCREPGLAVADDLAELELTAAILLLLAAAASADATDADADAKEAATEDAERALRMEVGSEVSAGAWMLASVLAENENNERVAVKVACGMPLASLVPLTTITKKKFCVWFCPCGIRGPLAPHHVSFGVTGRWPTV